MAEKASAYCILFLFSIAPLDYGRSKRKGYQKNPMKFYSIPAFLSMTITIPASTAIITTPHNATLPSSQPDVSVLKKAVTCGAINAVMNINPSEIAMMNSNRCDALPVPI